jgi:hypothetical protein
MNNITLISTEHRTSGKCSPDELYKIIESINPEVIFEEETNDDTFHKHFNDVQNSSLSLEIQCIKKYLQNHNVKHIPVDIEPNQYLSFSEWDYMFNTFRKYDMYKRIEKQHCAFRDIEGFAYLNSKKCLELFDEIKITEKQLIEFSGINKNSLLQIHQLFHKEHDNRENEMLLNIFNYTKENQYSEAVFLLGYAHRKSMMKKIQRSEEKGELKLNWTFYEAS